MVYTISMIFWLLIAIDAAANHSQEVLESIKRFHIEVSKFLFSDKNAVQGLRNLGKFNRRLPKLVWEIHTNFAEIQMQESTFDTTATPSFQKSPCEEDNPYCITPSQRQESTFDATATPTFQIKKSVGAHSSSALS
jgi:hypothetical protein